MEQTFIWVGPIRTSCLTCRRRHKKCDKAKPKCRVCAVSGHDCLGYDDQGEGSAKTTLEEPPDRPENVANRPASHAARPLLVFSSTSTGETLSATPQEYGLPSTSGMSNVVIDSSRTHVRRNSAFTNSSYDALALMNFDSTNTFGSFVPHKSTSSDCSSTSQISSVASTQQSFGTPVFPPIPLPQNMSPIPNNVARIVYFTLSQFERLIDMSHVRPSYDLFARFRENMKWQLQCSDGYRASMFVGRKILESFIDGTSSQKLAYYTRFIAKLEWHLRLGLDRNMTAAESHSRYTGILEITLLKLMFTSGVNTYRILQHAAPTMVQIASADPSLWIKSSGFTYLSLAHVLASTQYQLARFVLLGSVCSMSYALPPVVEYDTSTSSLCSDLNHMEWIYGCPVEFQFALVEINQCCHSLSRIGPRPDWRAIEHRVKTWQPKARSVPDKKSWKTVARLAIQESWRHALLIYLYMAIDGVASDDIRVRTSVQQVFRLAGAVERLETQSINSPFLVQHLIAGICTPYENQRARTETRLSATSDLSGLWLLRGFALVPVLAHLWHGAAANGQAIRWSDYIHSRMTVLPFGG